MVNGHDIGWSCGKLITTNTMTRNRTVRGYAIIGHTKTCERCGETYKSIQSPWCLSCRHERKVERMNGYYKNHVRKSAKHLIEREVLAGGDNGGDGVLGE